MKIVQINTVCGTGSTGKICQSISELLTKYDIENYILYNSGKSKYPLGVKCGNDVYIKMQALRSKILGNYGFNSKSLTKHIIRKFEEISPDIVHLHNIHSHDCNLEILFEYFRTKDIKLVWTFHDCWTITGYCPHFTMVNCDKWKTKCQMCAQRKCYSLFFDNSKKMYEKKKNIFSNLNLTIVTPSQWLADIVKESFLKQYPIFVINNGIDLDIFCPKESDFRKKYNVSNNKYILLGVASEWGIRKGLDVFIELTRQLSDKKYQIVLVGTNRQIDSHLPTNIISIHRTQNQKELAEIYSTADVFLNPTREDNFPTVNIEALACGTPVITFNTGGSPEIIDDTCGSVVERDNIEALVQKIQHVCNNKPYSEEDCRRRAEQFDKDEKYAEYMNLYMGEVNE